MMSTKVPKMLSEIAYLLPVNARISLHQSMLLYGRLLWAPN